MAEYTPPIEPNMEEIEEKFKTAPAIQLEVKGKSVRDWTPKMIAIFITVAFVYIQYMLITTIVEQSMREIVIRSLGTLDTLVVLVFSYYFGSSLSSQKKSDHIENLTTSQKE